MKTDPGGKASGRGAYLCRDAGCLKKAMRSGALGRSLKMQIPESLYEALAGQIAGSESTPLARDCEGQT